MSQIVAVAWHCSTPPLLLRNVALLQQAATLLLRNGYSPRVWPVLAVAELLRRGGSAPPDVAL
jgi:hypothetical protein